MGQRLLIHALMTTILASALSSGMQNSLKAGADRSLRVDQSMAKASARPGLAAQQRVTTIPLEGPITDENAEISGLAWYGDTLVLMPQYPDWGDFPEDGFLFTLSKTDILDYLNGELEGPLTPEVFTLVAPGLIDSISGFEGYESIAFAGDQVYMSIESEQDTGMVGYLISGTVNPDENLVELDVDRLATIPARANVTNASEEAILIVDDQILTFYEINSVVVNPEPVAHAFDSSLEPLGTISLAPLEWRITDATELDEDSRFWVLNVSAPVLAVEQMVEYEYSPDGIALSGTPPVTLALAQDWRNWEGLARLNGQGFLIITDKDPNTTLAYIPIPPSIRLDSDELMLEESGGSIAYDVRLNSAPSSLVTVDITTDGQSTVSPSTLTFDTSSWNDPQTVTITVVDDFEDEPSPLDGIITHSTSSRDIDFEGLIATLTIQIIDNDEPPPPQILVEPVAGELMEGGASVDYTVVLSKAPTEPVEISLRDDNQIAILPHRLNFTLANWDEPQIVTVRAVGDTKVEKSPHTGTIQHIANSEDGEYAGLSSELTVQILDAPVDPARIPPPGWIRIGLLVVSALGLAGLIGGFVWKVRL